MGFSTPIKEKDVNSTDTQRCQLQTKSQQKGGKCQNVSVCMAKEEKWYNYMQIEIVGFDVSFEYKFKDWLDEDREIIG